MIKFLIFLSILSSISYSFSQESTTLDRNEKIHFPKIKIKENVWNGGAAIDIQKVLDSVTRQIWPFVQLEKLDPICVNRSRTGPIVLYERGEQGEYLVKLNTEKTYWCQYAFQFAHELGHIICGYKKGDRSNLWFEETICETVSLFILRRMTKEWKKEPPYPNWKSYGPEFAKYAQKRMDKNPWPNELSLSQWYQDNEIKLVNEPTDRNRNVKLANKLLPYFEKDPKIWSAFIYLNTSKSKEKLSFIAYLKSWEKNCQTVGQRKFVSKLINDFGLSS